LIAVGWILILSIGGTTFGQGGGRETSKPSQTKPASKKPPTRTASTFRPSNPRIELIRIAPGSFLMGSTSGYADEKPVHRVTINNSFYVGKYEVTQAQWQSVMGSNPSKFKSCDNCPVEQVSWNDTQAFLRELNQMNDGYIYRLPTEAEWEYASRAGTTADYAGDFKRMAWFSENAGDRTHAVGQKQPNVWELADMLGNVWEWCEDWYHENYYGAPTSGVWSSGGEKKYRVLRGGSWSSSSNRLSSAFRDRDLPDYRDPSVGFRVVALTRY
jgi:formylglycine-generating enzyme required for sulfatase activity